MERETSQSHERRALFIVLSALLVDTIGFGIIIPVMPDLITGLTHTTLAQAARLSGWLMGVFAAMQFLFGPVMGGLGDHFGRRPVLLTSMLAFGLDYLVMGMAPLVRLAFRQPGRGGDRRRDVRSRHRVHRRHHAARAARPEFRA